MRIRWPGTGCPTSASSPPAEQRAPQSSRGPPGRYFLISPTAGTWRLRWPISQNNSPSPLGDRTATWPRRLCLCAPMAMWRGHLRPPYPKPVNCVAYSRSGSGFESLFRTDFVLVFLGHVLDSLILRLREAFPRLAGARGGIQCRLRLTLKMRHDFGGEQFG